MKKFMFMAACVAVGLSSCSDNEVYTNMQSSNSIAFETYQSSAITKGDELTSFATDSTIGVYAYNLGSALLTAGIVPNLMCNQLVTCTTLVVEVGVIAQ